MSYVGGIVLVAGLIAWGLQVSGNAPAALIDLNISSLVWLGVAFAGGVVLYFNRRPGN